MRAILSASFIVGLLCWLGSAAILGRARQPAAIVGRLFDEHGSEV
jgi:hypothetical protein